MEELCPFFVYEIAVGLQRVMDGLIDAVVRDVAGEVPEELEPRQRGFAALERKGDLRILAQAKRAVNKGAHGLGLHHAVTFDLAMRRHVCIETVSAAHVAKR